MPLAKGNSKRAKKARAHEFRHGATYARTRRKFGKARANRQLTAVIMHGGSKKRKSKKRKTTAHKRKSRK